MEKALTSGFGRTAGQDRKAGKREGSRLRQAVCFLRQMINGTPEESVPEGQDLCVNVCGCTVSVFSLQDYPLTV